MLAAIVYDTVTKKPLMVIADATDAQLSDLSHNPPNSAQVVINMQQYNDMSHDDLIALIPQ